MINDSQIANLVERFYSKARYDPLLGPIFSDAIGTDWDSHLATMRAFWSTVMMGSGTYKGNPMAAHLPLPLLSSRHFERWLELWRVAVLDVCGNDGLIFIQRAETMAGRLLAAVTSGAAPASHVQLSR
jgi:hemoglobin